MKVEEMNSILSKIIQAQTVCECAEVFMEDGWLRGLLAFLPALGFYFYQVLN